MRHQRSHLEILFERDGAILLITLLFLLLLTILGTSSLYFALTESVLSVNIEADARAFYIAESGIAQGLYWFNHSDQFSGMPEDFFKKRQLGNTSFFSEDGTSQYTGTQQIPDLEYYITNTELKIFGPATPGALCTLESVGQSARIRRVVSVELYDEASGVRILPGSWRVD